MTVPAFDLTGHRALVTGASSGLGRHFAATLAAAGAAVALAARRADKLAEAVAELRGRGATVCGVEVDVTDRGSIEAALDAAAGALGGPLDIVVNNAGTTEMKRVFEFTDEDWDRVVDTNLRGCWIVAQEAARRLVAAGVGGSVINVTSILGIRVGGHLTSYCASKAGLRHLTQSMALDLARHEIRVNSLAPGYIATDLNRDFLASPAGEALRSRVPTRRFGRLADLDGALLLLASDASAYMTGAEIIVDGGHVCSSL